MIHSKKDNRKLYEDLAIYTDEDILNKVGFYLKHEDLREKIAMRGQQIVHNSHTYAHRLDELINVCLKIKKQHPILSNGEREIG